MVAPPIEHEIQRRVYFEKYVDPNAKANPVDMKGTIYSQATLLRTLFCFVCTIFLDAFVCVSRGVAEDILIIPYENL